MSDSEQPLKQVNDSPPPEKPQASSDTKTSDQPLAHVNDAPEEKK